jgi:hypothetical protein
LIVGYLLVLMAFTTSVLLIPGEKYDTLTTSDSGWVYITALEIENRSALAEYNPYSHAPYGLSIPPGEQLQPLLSVMLCRGLKVLNASVSLTDVVKYWAPFVFALSLIPIFLIGRELGGDVGGVATAFFAATMVSTIYWHKVGSFDREPIQLVLGAWSIYLTIKLFKAPRHLIPKFAILGGLVYGLFGLAWGGWHYVIAILVLGGIFVLAAGFLGKFLRKPSDFTGALLSGIRGHLDVIGGVFGVMVVITLAQWTFAGQGPGFWVGIFGAYAGYLGIGGGGGVSFTAYAAEMQPAGSWGDVLGKFYGSNVLTAVVLILVILTFLRFCISRKRWEILTFAWLVVLMAMVWPGKGQARFERLWWPFIPAMAGAGVAVAISFVQRISFEPYGEHLKHLQNPIALLVVGAIITAPFLANAYTTASQITPPTEWHASGLDAGLMEAFAWVRENTPENSVFSIQWSFGHLFAGATLRPTVCDGAEIRAEEGTWENDPSFAPRPPDYIYRVEGNSAYIYGLDTGKAPRKQFGINGRRIDVGWLPLMGENEFRWLIRTYRDNYGVKIDYVILSIDEFYQAYDYYSTQQPVDILLRAERIRAPSSLKPTLEGMNYVFNFGENREAVVLDTENKYVYLRTAERNLFMDGYAVMVVNSVGKISEYKGFHTPYYTPDIQETLLIILDESGNFWTAWLIRGVSAEMSARQLPMGVQIFGGGTQGINYLQVVFTSSNNTVKIIKINHAPSLVSPENGGLTNDNTPDFSWDTIGASRYELLVDEDPSFSSPLIHEDKITDTAYTSLVELQDGEYWWRVAAYDAGDHLLGWSDQYSFTVDTRAPGCPVPSEPQDGAVLQTLDVTFRWTEPEHGVKYDIVIDDEDNFSTPYVDVTYRLTDNSYERTFERNGKYYWRVRARDQAGNMSEWSGTFVLIVRAPPQAPALSSPENGAPTKENTPTLKWRGGNGDNYRLLVGTDPDFSSPALDVLLAPSVTSYKVEGENALPDGYYYWKVAAVVGSDENSSDVWVFTVDTAPPQAPALRSPRDGTETDDSTPTFEWSPSPEAENYRLLVGTDAELSSPEIDVWLAGTTYTPATGLPAGDYYWKVVAKDAAGNENESPVQWFRIITSGG